MYIRGRVDYRHAHAISGMTAVLSISSYNSSVTGVRHRGGYVTRAAAARLQISIYISMLQQNEGEKLVEWRLTKCGSRVHAL